MDIHIPHIAYQGLPAVAYFLPPEEILGVIRWILSLEELAGAENIVCGYRDSDDIRTWWVETTTGTAVMSESNAGYILELFNFELDEVNTGNVRPDFILTRLADDSAWTAGLLPERGFLAVISDFEKLTDLFYFDQLAVFEHVSGLLSRHGLAISNNFTLINALNKLHR